MKVEVRMDYSEFWGFGNFQLFESIWPWEPDTCPKKYDLFHNAWIFLWSKVAKYTHDTISDESHDKYITIRELFGYDFTYHFGSPETFENPIFYFSMSHRDSHKEVFGTSFEKFRRFDLSELTLFGGSSNDEFHNITMDISEGFRMKYIVESTILCLYGYTFFTKKEFSFSM